MTPEEAKRQAERIARPYALFAYGLALALLLIICGAVVFTR